VVDGSAALKMMRSIASSGITPAVPATKACSEQQQQQQQQQQRRRRKESIHKQCTYA
jgi:hypothetical protein